MSSYESAVGILETELSRVEQAFRDLSDDDWEISTLLRPVDESLPRWTLLELAGHFQISIGLTRTLVAEQAPRGQVGRDRVSFFIFARSEVAPVVYDYAYLVVDGKESKQLIDLLHETFTQTIADARSTPPETIGSGYYALMRLDEFVPSRVVEAVVHGIDLTDAVGRAPIATPEGVAMTAQILDELLARRTVPGRPADLGDDLAWIRAASGRAEHRDPRLPLIG